VQAPAELEAFFQRERPRLVGALSLYTGDALLAGELADEALTRACERWAEVSRMQAPGAWVHRVGINLANSFFRRRHAERRARHRAAAGSDDVRYDADAAEAVAIRRAVADCPARQRECIVLRYYVGLSVAEAAARMDTSDSAIKSLTYRAIESLRDQFALDMPAPQEVDDATA
jgi:RNA polymerase sigma factor (sigma-70 family)